MMMMMGLGVSFVGAERESYLTEWFPRRVRRLSLRSKIVRRSYGDTYLHCSTHSSSFFFGQMLVIALIGTHHRWIDQTRYGILKWLFSSKTPISPWDLQSSNVGELHFYLHIISQSCLYFLLPRY